MSRRREVIALFSALIVVGVLVAGAYVVGGGSTNHDAVRISSGDAQQLAAAASDQAPQDAAMDAQSAATVVDNIIESYPDPIPWSGPGGSVVYVKKADYRRVLEASFQGLAPIMVPAADGKGELRGYVAIQLGVIPKDVAEAPGFDLATTVANAKAKALQDAQSLSRTATGG